MLATNRDELEIDKLRVEINKIIAETAKVNKEVRWYEVVTIGGSVAVLIGATALAVKLFG